MNSHLSNIISIYLEAIADEMDNNREVISTENALSRIDRYNRKVDDDEDSNLVETVEEGGFTTDEEEFLELNEIIETQESDARQNNNDIAIIGSDVISLYPSITTELAGEMGYEATILSKIDFEIDFLEIVTYLAINMNFKEIRKQGIFKDSI